MFRLNVTILEESVRVSQVLLDRSPSMTGRKRGLDSEVPSKKLYRCNAVGCAVTPRGCDLPNHYQTKTNWEKVKKLRATMGTSALEKQLSGAGRGVVQGQQLGRAHQGAVGRLPG